MRYRVKLQYPYTRYYETVIEVEAADVSAALTAANLAEARGEVDWDTSYPVGDGECGPTEVWSIEPSE